MNAYFNSLKIEAAKLGAYTKMSIDDLADNYCAAIDANDDVMMGRYISALMLRFWHQIGKMQSKTQTANVSTEELIDSLYDCINVACHYRAWQKEDENGNRPNAQSCINRAINSRGSAAFMYRSNLKKNAGAKLTTSLEEELDADNGLSIADTIEDPSTRVVYDGAHDIVQECINDNHIIEAIIADVIAHSEADFFTHSKIVCKTDTDKYTEYCSEFAPRKLVKVLNALDDEYAKYFKSQYKVLGSLFDTAASRLVAAKNTKKYQMIDRTTSYLRARL